MVEDKNEFVEFKQSLERRTLLFSASVMNVLAKLPYRKTLDNIIFQLSKSATSIGANYRESNHSESRADFIHKISIVIKEANETIYWLDLVELCEFIAADEKLQFAPLRKEANELYALFITIMRNTRDKYNLTAAK